MKDKIISVAPMMDWTDRHCRYFHRLLAPSVTLYTEMVICNALIYGDRDRFLRFDPSEHPLVLQLGGSDPQALATCAKIAEDFGYDAVNLNCGCPSDRVQSGSFGACLMKEPERVADCIKAMQDSVSIPITVKSRIGIDDCEDFPFLKQFIDIVATQGGCKTFIIHARKAWLHGLSPKENRDIPPLRYDIVRDLKAEYPQLDIQINGGIKTIEQISSFLRHPVGANDSELAQTGSIMCSALLNSFTGSPLLASANADRGDDICGFNGVMIGREAYQNPLFLRQIEQFFYKTDNILSEQQIIETMMDYIAREHRNHGVPVKSITRHMVGLFQGRRGARLWRQVLSTEAHLEDASPAILQKAYACLDA